MKITKIQQITREKWLNLYTAEFENAGHTGRWSYCSRQPQPVEVRRPDAVILVPILRAAGARPRLVMLKEFRIPVGGYVYALPAGLVDDGEDVEQAARREMLEETGLTVTRVKRTSPLLFSSAGMSDESVLMIYVDVKAEDGHKPALGKSEEIEVLLLDFAAARRLGNDRTACFDAKAWMALETYRQLGRFV